MPLAPAVHEDLLRRLPLPLAQLYRRAHNAKTPLERHHAAYYLWEAALKLLACVAVVEYAELGDHDPELAERLRNLARPALGHWWEFVRRLLPVLADHGVRGFAPARDLLLGKTRDDLPHAAGLEAVLAQVLEGRDVPRAQATVRPTELFDRLVRYRNREFGHGAVGQRPAAFYERIGRALLAGVPELLGRLDVLAGRRLLYFADVRRHASGRWLVERFELLGETARRLESLDLPDGEAVRRLLPERLYLDSAPDGTAPEAPGPVCLHPLLIYEPDAGEVLFLNARRGRERIDYLSYSTGREEGRDDLASEQRELLARVLHAPVDAPSVANWAARSTAEDRADGAADDGPAAPRRLGEFELLSELGRGGMGVVYRAWQPSLGRQVAVKALYSSGDPKAEARFAREVRALGHVEHPYLVKIFTSGSDGDRWFYAMELVEGATLAAVCEKLQSSSTGPDTVDVEAWQQAVSTVCAQARQAEKPISDTAGGPPAAPLSTPAADTPGPPGRGGRGYIRRAVELVRQAAEAAHALHEKGILHRDIKPGNVMVTADGSQAVLMDLGLAQIADEVEGRLTRTRQFVGTLRYASPEQVLAVGGLDRRSDVYNLGATLWELLTLRPMFGATDQTPTPELMQRIQLEDAVGPRKYHPRLSRDLEAIVLKCLEKDPRCRYATARELARDLERYQAGEPVQARPVGGLQRTWRWCRRKPALASMLGVLVLVILGSLAGLTVLYLNAENQRQLAEDREAGARAVTHFYEEYVLAAARPKGQEGGGGKDVTLKEALDQAAPHIDQAFEGQPRLEADVRDTLGMTYWYLGQYEAARPHLERAYEIRRKRLGPDHPDTLTSLHNLAMERWKEDRVGEAVTLCRQALEGRRRVLGPELEDTLFSQLKLGLYLLADSRYNDAEPILRDAIEACKRTLSPNHKYTLHGQNDLALVLNNNGKLQEALELDRDTLAKRREALGADHPSTLLSMANVACSLWSLDRFEEAETLCREALDARRRVLGEGHSETFWSRDNLAGILEDRGKLKEAEALRRETLEMAQRLRGPDEPETLKAMTSLGKYLRGQGQLEEAGKWLRQALDASRTRLGPEHPSTLARQCQVAWWLDDSGKMKEAEELYRKTLGAQLQVRGPQHTDTLTTENNLACLLQNEGQAAEAERLFQSVFDVRRRVQGPAHPQTFLAEENLAGALSDQCKWEEAETHYRSALDARRRAFGPDATSVLSTQVSMASLLSDEGKLAEALELDRRTLEVRQRVLGPEHPDTLVSKNNVAYKLRESGRLAEAEELDRAVLAVRNRVQGPEHPDTLSVKENLADVLAARKHWAEAESLCRAALKSRRRDSGPEHPETLGTQSLLAGFLEEEGKLDEAETLYRQTLDGRRRALGARHPATLRTQRLLAVVLGERGKSEEALGLFREVLAVQREVLAPGHVGVAETLAEYGLLLTRIGRAAEAEPLLAECRAIREKKLAPGYWPIAEAHSLLAGALAGQGKFAEAEPLILDGCAGLAAAEGTPARRLGEAQDRAVALYEKWGKPEQAAAWRKKRAAGEPPHH
jgi:serine/threonine protein kinase